MTSIIRPKGCFELVRVSAREVICPDTSDDARAVFGASALSWMNYQAVRFVAHPMLIKLA